jgi:hypothetical protein
MVHCKGTRVPYSDPNDPHACTLPLRAYRQVDSFRCGYVAGAMVLHTFYPQKSLRRFYVKTRVDEDGVWQGDLVRSLRASGIAVTPRYDLTFPKIKKIIQSGRLIIVAVLPGEVSHWAVVYGYSDGFDRRHRRRKPWLYVAGNILPEGYLFSNKIRWETFRDKLGDPAKDGLVCSPQRCC